MTQSKGSFTPGPWEQLPGFVEKGHPSYVEGRLIVRIVQKRAPGQTEFVKIALVDAGPVAANARLIAAAPALLEALRYVVRIHSVPDVSPENQPHEIIVAMAAIQSATGEG
jgi:hypothetical protein